MKYFALIMTLFFINFNQKTAKLTGRYNYLIEDEGSYILKDKITFSDSVFKFDNKYLPKGKISYGKNLILLENFINIDLLITIPKDQIEKDTIIFYMHNQNAGGNYLDISSGKGKLIRIK